MSTPGTTALPPLPPLHIIVLAAGKGTRMRSQKPKVMHALAGRPLLDWVLSLAHSLAPKTISLVYGPEMDSQELAVRAARQVLQEERLGTGHAVHLASQALGREDVIAAGDCYLVLYADTPFLSKESLARLFEIRAHKKAALMALAFKPEDPAAYGRVLIDSMGAVEEIREYADLLTEFDELEVAERFQLCNAGVLAGDCAALDALLPRLERNNAKEEYYLTDLFALARAEGLVTNYSLAEEKEVLGINSRPELARAEALVQERLRAQALESGVSLVDPRTVIFSHDTKLGEDVTVHPFVVFGPGVEVAAGAEIFSFSHLEGAQVEAGAKVGPHARLRPGSLIGKGARVGNFVEVKNASLAAGAKANHLSYLGDASLGEKVNIGAGTIICNYDGFAKHRTEIGAGTFIGSNSSLVAPLSIGEGVIIAAGSTIVKSVPDDALALARAKQETKAGVGKAYRTKKAKARSKPESSPRK